MVSCLKIALLLIFFRAKQNLCHEETCSYENDIDYLGQDLTLLPNYLDNPGLCCKSCIFNENCQIWTYVPRTGACWLKSSSGSLRITSYGSIFFCSNFRISLKED